MEYVGLVIGIMGGVWVYKDAKKRGKNRLAAFIWGLATLLFILIFLPLWLFTRPAPLLTCSHCGKHYQGERVYCPNCGQSLTDNQFSQPVE